MSQLSPEEKRALIAQALTKKMGDPAITSGFDVGGPSQTARGFAPPIPPAEESDALAPMTPMAPLSPTIQPAAPVAPPPPMRTMADTEPAAFAEPEPVMPPAPAQPMPLPTEKDYLGKYTTDDREEMRAGLDRKSTLGLLPGILSMFGDAQANASGVGGPIDGTGKVIQGVEDDSASRMADFDTGRKQKIENYLTGIKARAAGREEAVETDNTNPATPLSNAKRQVLKSLGYKDDLSGLSGAQMDPIIKSYLTKYTADQDAEGKRLTREAMAGERSNKREEKLKGLVVPGWELTGEVLPDDQEAKKARDGQANYEAFNSDLNQLKGLVSKYGTVELTGDESAEMEALVKSLQLNLKNIAQLGVLSASDIPFLTKQVPDVNTMKAVFTSSKTFNAGLDQSAKIAQQKFDKFMRSRGYAPKGGGGGGGGGPQPGTVEDGFRFKGGDPADQSNWERAK